MNKKTLLIVLAISLLLLQAGLLFFGLGIFIPDHTKSLWLPYISKSERIIVGKGGATSTSTIAHSSYFAKSDFYNEAFATASSSANSEHVYGGILPHHLLVKDQIASFLDGLSGQNYDTVIVIGPNHFEVGKDVLTSKADWQTPYGTLASDKPLIEKLGLVVDESPFVNEHSISGLVAFIKKSLPKTKIVPIILRVGVNATTVNELALSIKRSVDPNKTLVLASVDFSHYQPLPVADYHDEFSRAVIEGFDFRRIARLEVDSPASLGVVMRYTSEVGAQQARLLVSTNSGRLQPSTANYTTSHNFYYFTKGSARQGQFFSGLFFGDLMLDRYVGELIGRSGVNRLLGGLVGEEGRFLSGSDLISANLEGAVTNGGVHYSPSYQNDFAFSPSTVKEINRLGFNFFNTSNNHLADQGARGVLEARINLDELAINYSGCPDRAVDTCSAKLIDVGSSTVAMLGFSAVYGSIDSEKVVKKIKESKVLADYVVVNIHWGSEYQEKFNSRQQVLAHAMIEAGADAIIGHHPHVVQGVEVYQGHPIFYSLGNFVFDQYFSKATQQGLSVGLYIRDKKFKAYLLPLDLTKSQPKLMKDGDKSKFLENLADKSASDKDLRAAIKTGLVSGAFNN